MKKITAIICFIVLAVQILTGCSANKRIQFEDIYQQVIPFSDNDVTMKPVPQDTILMMTNEEYTKFVDDYFKLRQLPIALSDPEKAALYIQIAAADYSVDQYRAEKIYLKDNTLTVSLEKVGTSKVKAPEGFKGSFKWVMFIVLDKAELKSDMKIVIKK